MEIEWEKSHLVAGSNTALWTPSGRSPISVRVLTPRYEFISEYTQACIKTLNWILDASGGKASCISFNVRVHAISSRGNPKKEKLKDIPCSSCRHSLNRHIPIAPTDRASQTLNHTRRLRCREVTPVAPLPRGICKAYNHTKSIHRRDNPNKEPPIDIPYSVNSYSLTIHAWIGQRWEKSQQYIGCVCHR